MARENHIVLQARWGMDLHHEREHLAESKTTAPSGLGHGATLLANLAECIWAFHGRMVNAGRDGGDTIILAWTVSRSLRRCQFLASIISGSSHATKTDRPCRVDL